MTKKKMLEEFAKLYGDSEGVRVFFAPGRVNLIGEHTDYNGGHVFPCAIPLGTYAAIRKREDSKIRFFSLNYEQNGIIENQKKDLEIHKHNLEEERLAVKVLKEKNDKIEEKLNSLTGTLDKICELGAYYKNFAK